MKKILKIMLIGFLGIQGTALGYDEKTFENDIEGCNAQAIMNKSEKVAPVVKATLINNPSLLQTALKKKDELDGTKEPAKKNAQEKLAKQKTNIVEIISYFLEILNKDDVQVTDKIIQIKDAVEAQLNTFKADKGDAAGLVETFLKKFVKKTDNLEIAKLKTELGQLKTSLSSLQEKLNTLNLKLNALQTKLA